MAKKKSRIDGLSLSIVILNVLIVGVIITLCVLIFLYMTGKLENADVANLGQDKTPSAIVTTQITTVTTVPEVTTTEATEVTEADMEVTDTTTAEVIEAVESDSYDESFFENDLFIGDSISTGLVNYGYLKGSNVFAEVGLNPESAVTKEIDGYTSISKAEEMKPKRIYIMLGSNGLAYLGNTYMIQQMGLLLDALREASPDSYIYVISIPPVTKVHDSEGQETMAMVNGYNKLLKDFADENGVVYLDLCGQLQDSTGYFSDKYAEVDGMHFLGSAYKKMLSFIQKSIES